MESSEAEQHLQRSPAKSSAGVSSQPAAGLAAGKSPSRTQRCEGIGQTQPMPAVIKPVLQKRRLITFQKRVNTIRDLEEQLRRAGCLSNLNLPPGTVSSAAMTAGASSAATAPSASAQTSAQNTATYLDSTTVAFRGVSAADSSSQYVTSQITPGVAVLGQESTDSLLRSQDKQAKESLLLRKTIDEMELRIETQRQTLQARDESIKKLLEMLQSKGLSREEFLSQQRDVDSMRGKLIETEKRIKQLETVVEQKERELAKIREDVQGIEVSRLKQQADLTEAKREVDNSAAMLQIMMETKDSRIATLERELKSVEEKFVRAREETSAVDRHREDVSKQLDTLRNSERVLKSRVETLKAEVSKKETDLACLRSRLETLDRQQSDQQKHIGVLKEQITAKDTQCSMLMNDVDIFRDRIKEKDAVLEKKTKQFQQVQGEKRKAENEVTELKDHMEIKERKIVVLQKKIENLEDILSDKESQLSALKTRLATLHADHSSNSSTVQNLQDTISDREKIIEKLKQQRERCDEEHQEECEMMQKQNQELKNRMELLQKDLDIKQVELLDAREELSGAKTEKKKQEEILHQLEGQLEHKANEANSLQSEIDRVKTETTKESSENVNILEQRIHELDALNVKLKDEMGQLHEEMDRLLAILKETEQEKFDKEKQVDDLQEQARELQLKFSQLKKSQQSEKKKTAQLLEEARRRELDMSSGTDAIKTSVTEKEERIKELEDTLRESVKITAEREILLEEQKKKIAKQDDQVIKLTSKLDEIRGQGQETTEHIAKLNEELQARDLELETLKESRKKQMEDVFEMKQEALLAAMSEKDAHIALLELTTGGKLNPKQEEHMMALNREKGTLHKKLKELTESRMNLMQNSTDAHPPSSTSTIKQQNNPSTNARPNSTAATLSTGKPTQNATGPPHPASGQRGMPNSPAQSAGKTSNASSQRQLDATDNSPGSKSSIMNSRPSPLTQDDHISAKSL